MSTVFEYRGICCRIGHHARANTELIRSADPTDIWIHVAEHSGAHCVVEMSEIRDKLGIHDVVAHCCIMIKEKSNQLCDLRMVKFHITHVSNLKICKNPGQVQFISMKDVETYTAL